MDKACLSDRALALRLARSRLGRGQNTSSQGASGLRKVLTSPTSSPTTSARTMRRASIMPERVFGELRLSIEVGGNAHRAFFCPHKVEHTARLSLDVSFAPCDRHPRKTERGQAPFRDGVRPRPAHCPRAIRARLPCRAHRAFDLSQCPCVAGDVLLTSSDPACERRKNEPSSCAIGEVRLGVAHGRPLPAPPVPILSRRVASPRRGGLPVRPRPLKRLYRPRSWRAEIGVRRGG